MLGLVMIAMTGWIGEWLRDAERQWLAGDGAIIDRLHRLEADPPTAWCSWCGLSVGLGERREPCLSCDGLRRRHRRVVRLSELQGDWRSVLLRVKYGCDAVSAEILGCRLVEQFRNCGGLIGSADTIVVPVPASPLRRWHRGIDPVGEIAVSFARSIAAPLVRPIRHAGGVPRTGQTRAERRSRRLALRWGWRDRRALAGLRVVLVDDVLTTGATIHEATTLLRTLGVEEVEAAVVAVTPTPGRATRQQNVSLTP